MIEAAYTKAESRTGYDNWQINTAVHFNQWAGLQKEVWYPWSPRFADSPVCLVVPPVPRFFSWRQIGQIRKLYAVGATAAEYSRKPTSAAPTCSHTIAGVDTALMASGFWEFGQRSE